MKKTQALSPDLLNQMDAYWRHAHTKPHLLGLWGTTPGPNFIYVHLNLNVINITGPGHGEPGFVANTYLDGTYSEVYPNFSQDEDGLKGLITQFSGKWPLLRKSRATPALSSGKKNTKRHKKPGMITLFFGGFRMKSSNIDSELTRRRYDRVAFFYDYLESPMEWLQFAPWRARLRDRITGERALEAGVGTGKNLAWYPSVIEITAIDFSPRMLDRARKKADMLGLHTKLVEMDVQDLAFPDQFFDTVFATFVFCSVPDPVQGLRELRRVCKPGGILILLEHMRPDGSFLGPLFDFLNPIVVRLVGSNINRKTSKNIQKAGWRIRREEHLSSDIVRWIEAEP